MYVCMYVCVCVYIQKDGMKFIPSFFSWDYLLNNQRPSQWESHFY